MKVKIKTQFKKISKFFLIFLLGFQLAFSPCLSYAQYPNGSNGSNGSKAVSIAKQFNKDVLALREIIYGDATEGTTYESHPLDVFGLLNQKVGFPIEEEKAETEKKELTAELTAEQADAEKKELTAEQATKQIAEQTVEQAEQVAKQIAEQDKPTYKKDDKDFVWINLPQKEKTDKPTYRKRTKEYWKKKATKGWSYVKGPVIAPPRPQTLLFEVYNQAGELVSVFSHESKKAELPFRRPDLKDKITNPEGFIAPAWEKDQSYSLKISYQGRLLHSFPQNIIWASTIGDYLLFLEPSLVSDKKAVVSFIDLEYFTTALGKTTLPIFRIPVSFQNRTSAEIEKLTDLPLPLAFPDKHLLSPLPGEKEVKNSERNKVILSPEFILNEGVALNIGGFRLSLEYIHFLSRLQQFHFNFSVSLVDPSGFAQATELIKDILRTYTEPLTKDFTQKNGPITLEQQEQFAILQQILVKSIQVRNSIGSQSRPSGAFGKIANAQATLATEQDTEEDKEIKKLKKAFSENLKKDVEYQKGLQNIADNRSKELKKFARMKTFLAHITRPRPLGAPKIKQALGLVAGTVLPGESIKGRWFAFKERTAQVLSYGSAPVKSAALIGLGSLAHPDVAHFFYQGLVLSYEWLSQIGTIVGTHTSTVAHGINVTNLPSIYFSDGKYVYLFKGITVLFGAFLGFVGITHFLSNLYNYNKSLKSQKVQNHNQLARGLLSRSRNSLKKFFNKGNFVSYVAKEKQDYIDDLSRAEWEKNGLFVHIKESKKPWTEIILQVPKTEWKRFFSIFQSKEKPIEWEMLITPEGSEIPLVLSLKTTEEKLNNLPTLSLKISDEDKTVVRQFEILSGKKDAFLEQGGIKRGITVNFSTEDLYLQGQMLSTKYTEEEVERVRQVVYEALKTKRKKQNGINLLDNIESEQELRDRIIEQSLPSSKEIKTMRSAWLHLLLGYSSWTKTFKSMGLMWNWFFLIRNFVFRPTAGLSGIWFAHYFDRISEKKHVATRLNGAYNSRLGDGARWLKASLSAKEKAGSVTYAQLRRARKTFEEQVIPIEKQFMVESINIAYFNLVERAAISPKPRIDAALRKGRTNPDRPRKDIKDVFYKELRGKERMVFEIHWRSLFKEGMKDFLIERAGLPKNLSNSKAKRQFILKLQSGEVDLSIEDKKKTEERLWRVNKELKLAQKARKVVHSMLSGFLKKRQVKYAMKSEKILQEGLVMERFDMAKRLLKEPEALARTSRFMMAKIVVDKPIQLLWLFVILAGVDTGVMQVLHDKAFTEDALFHLSRYAIWFSFFGFSLMDILSGVWLKVQVDSMAPTSEKLIPKKADVRKRFAYIRWLFEQFIDPKHTYWESVKSAAKLTYANLGAALIMFGGIYAFALGRFDIGLFLGLALFAIPLDAFEFKTEWSFERSVHFSLKELIKKGLDLDGKDKHLLTHPLVQAFNIKTSNKLRKQYNLAKVLTYDNIFYYVVELLQAGDVKGIGNRAFQRMLFGGSLPTEHLVNFLDWMEEKGVSSKVVNACKKAFTNNRSDLDL